MGCLRVGGEGAFLNIVIFICRLVFIKFGKLGILEILVSLIWSIVLSFVKSGDVRV